MGSQQSKNEKKFKRFWKKFLAAVVAINSQRKEGFAIEIELANGESIRLTWDILVQKFPGCTTTEWESCRITNVINSGNRFLWTCERFYKNGQLCPFNISGLPNQSRYCIFWELHLKDVKNFYNNDKTVICI